MPALSKEIRDRLIAAVVLSGVAAYFFHHPVPFFLYRLATLFLFVFFFLALVGFGAPFVFRKKFNVPTLLERWLLSFWIGCGAFAFVLSILGWFSAWTPQVLWLLVTAGVMMLIWFGIPFTGSAKSISIDRASLLPFTITALIFLAMAWVPITYYDSVVYHLALPNLYRIHHGWVGFPELIYSSFPQTVEMLWTACLLLWGDVWVNCLGAVFGLSILAGIYALSKRIAPAASEKSIWILGSAPFFLTLSQGGYVDIPLAMFTLGAFFCFFMWTQAIQNRWVLVCSGLLAGMALSTKYTGGLSVILLTGLIIWQKRKNIQEMVRSVAIFGAASFVVFLPWLIKNLIFVGNPVFPFLYQYGIATKNPWINSGAQGYFGMLSEYSPASWLGIFTLPFKVAILSDQFGGGADVLGDFGWALLVLFVPLAFGKKLSSGMKQLGLFGLLFFLVWAKTKPVLRFLIPLAPLMAVWSAAGWAAISEGRGWRQRLMDFSGYALILSNALYFFYISSITTPMNVAAGFESTRVYLTRKLDYYLVTRYIADKLPMSARIYVYGDQRSYYYERDVVASPVFSPSLLTTWVERAPSIADLASVLKAYGITHLVINDRERLRLATYKTYVLSESGEARLVQFLGTHAKLLYKDSSCRLYELL